MKLIRVLSLRMIAAGALALSIPSLAYADHDHDRHDSRDSHGHDWHGGDRWHHHWVGRVGFYGGGYYGPWYGPYYNAYGPTVVYRTVSRGSDRVEVDVQRALAKKGYYGGVLDGDIGPQTRAAIRAYQVDRGLPVSGRIDGNLLRSLDLL